MARCTVTLPDDLIKKLSTLGDKTDEIIKKMLDAGGDILLSKVRSNLDSVIGTGPYSRPTGQLQASLGISPMMTDKDGISNVKVGFSEPRSDGDSNAKIANILEYGSSKQPARPFLAPAKSASKSAVQEAMTSAFEEEIEKL